MYIVCLIFATLALIGCLAATAMLLKKKTHQEQDSLEAARRSFRARKRRCEHSPPE